MISGKSVFVIGYGASGAGKTTTLINFKKTPGIIIEILNSLRNENIFDDVITASIYEIFGNDETGTFQGDKTTNIYSNLKFQYQEQGGNYYLYNNTKTRKATSIYKDGNKYDATYAIIKENKIKISYNDNEIKIINTLTDFIVAFVDEFRMIAPTTNNPNSSRSHVIISISMKKRGTEESVQLIVGDLAGVENKFICNDFNTLEKYCTIKRDKDDQEPFYSNLLKLEDSYTTKDAFLQTIPEEDRKKYETAYNIMEFDKFSTYFTIDNNELTEENIGEKLKNMPIINKFYHDLNPSANDMENISKILGVKNINEEYNELFSSYKAKTKDIDDNKFYLTKADAEQRRLTTRIKDAESSGRTTTANILKTDKREIVNTIQIKTKEIEKLEDSITKLKKQMTTILKKSITDNVNLKNYNGNFAAQVLNILNRNQKIMKAVYQFCRKRTNEGIFINNSLNDMRNEITKLMRNTDGNSILGNIPEFDESCFKYYCNNIDNCFDTKMRSMKSTENAILNTLKKAINFKEGEDKLQDKLRFAVFCVFNSNKVYKEDPPIMPYIETTTIKKIKNEMELYNNNIITLANGKYLYRNKKVYLDMTDNRIDVRINNYINKEILRLTRFEYIESFVKEINTVYDKYASSIGKDLVESITKKIEEFISVLNKIKNEIGEAEKEEEEDEDEDDEDDEDDKLNNIKGLDYVEPDVNIQLSTYNTQFPIILKYLNEILDRVDNINALSILGTLDFTQTMKNNAAINIACNKYMNVMLNSKYLPSQSVHLYKHIVHDKLTFHSALQAQNEFIITLGRDMKGGQQKQIYLSEIDISLNDNYRQILNNVIFFNIFKFMRWSYYKKHDNMENIDTYIFKDYLMTIIVCVILHSIHQNNLAIGVFVDQILSMGMYYKYKNEKFLLLPYYLPFV